MEAVRLFQVHLLVSADFHGAEAASAVKHATREEQQEGQRRPLMLRTASGLSTSGLDMLLELVGTLSCRDSNLALARLCCGFGQRHQVVRMLQLLAGYLATQQM